MPEWISGNSINGCTALTMTAAQLINTAIRRISVWPIYVLSFGYFLWYFWRGLTGSLGAEPIKALEHALGEAALYMLVAGIAVTPVRKYLGVNLIKYRRAVGLSCFFFVVMHLLVWLVLDVQALDQIWKDILKRPYITVGMVGFVTMIPLAVTSNNWSARKLGSGWRQLHRLTYAAALLGGIHYVMLVRGWQIKPMIFLAVIVALLVVRVKWRKRLKNI